MQKERRAILALVAAGRISAGEAERLLRVWNERFEALWIAALCVLVCAAQLHPHVSVDAAGHWAHEVLLEGINAWNAAASLLRRGVGGTI